MRKQLTVKQDYCPLHLAARSGNIEMVMEIISNCEELALKELLSKKNHSGETALYVAAEFDFIDLVNLLIKYYDISMAGIKAINGYDALHVASKQGNLGEPIRSSYNIFSFNSIFVICLFLASHQPIPCINYVSEIFVMLF